MAVRTVKIVSLVSSETCGVLCANPPRAVSNPARLRTIVSRKRCPRKLLLDFGRSEVELKIVYEVAVRQVKQQLPVLSSQFSVASIQPSRAGETRLNYA